MDQTALRLALVQMRSTDRHAGNVAAMREAVAQADGADLVALPEAAGLMNRNREDARAQITAEGDDPFVAACRDAAARRGVWIHLGSTPVRAGDKVLNHTVLIDATGEIVARYDKIHLFDVFLEGRPPTGESERYAAGAEAVLVDTPWGPWGLTICYDLRFPHLYRDYARAGATLLFAPSAFTVPTGRAHWEVLLRARAIENGAFLVAAAQVGRHDDGRETYGHSLVVSPWGEVLADLGGEAPGQTLLELDLTRVAAARAQIPSLRNERPYRMTHLRRPAPVT